MQAKTLIAALLVGASAFSTVAFAQPPADCPMGGKMGRHDPERFAERMKAHQKRLHDALKLTPAQEAAWTKFQESHAFAGREGRPDPAESAKLTAPERAEKMLAWQKQHEEAMSKHVAALKEFYGQLTPEQQKIFDEHSGPRGERGRKGAKRPAPESKPAN